MFSPRSGSFKSNINYYMQLTKVSLTLNLGIEPERYVISYIKRPKPMSLSVFFH